MIRLSCIDASYVDFCRKHAHTHVPTLKLTAPGIPLRFVAQGGVFSFIDFWSIWSPLCDNAAVAMNLVPVQQSKQKFVL